MEKGMEDLGCIKRCAHKTAVIHPSWIIISTRWPMHTSEIRRCHGEFDRLQLQWSGDETLQRSLKIETGRLFDRITDEKVSDIAVSPAGTRFKVQSVSLNLL